jgi:hypothetical protein
MDYVDLTKLFYDAVNRRSTDTIKECLSPNMALVLDGQTVLENNWPALEGYYTQHWNTPGFAEDSNKPVIVLESVEPLPNDAVAILRDAVRNKKLSVKSIFAKENDLMVQVRQEIDEISS